jgi:hypothetical protein
MIKRSKISLAIAVATGFALSAPVLAEIPPVTAVADAMLNVTNFQIRTSSGGTLGLGVVQNGVNVLGATTTHNASTNINGTDGTNFKNINGTGLVPDVGAGGANSTSEVVNLGTSIIYYSTIGNLGSWTATNPYTETAVPGLTQFARAQSDSVGNAILGSDDITVHSTAVVTSGNQTANAASQQNLSSSFLIVVAGGSVELRLSFDAEGYLRTALGQDFFSPASSNNALASFSWSASVTGVDNNNQFNWTPDGAAGGISCSGAGVACSEVQDSFGMTRTLNAQGFKQDRTQAGPDVLPGWDITETLTGSFEALLTLPSGSYNFSIGHTTQADVTTPPLPVPGTLALLGIGLLGLGMKVKRKTA